MTILSEIFQKQYDFEHAHRSELTSTANSSIVAVTVVASATAVALLDHAYASTSLTYIFLTFALSTAIALAVSVYFIFRSLWNYIYQKLPTALALAKHHADLIAWYQTQDNSMQKAAELAEQDLQLFVGERFSEAAEWNGQNNIRRGNFLHMSTTSLAVALALFVPAAMIYAYGKAIAPEKVHLVQLTTPPHLEKEPFMSSNQNRSQTPQQSIPSTTPSAPSSSPTASPSKPVGPSNSQFRTNTEAPKPSANSDGK